MKRVSLLLLLLSVPVSAQERPIAGTTVQTTDTSANSLLVGCAVGSTTCTGGIKAGPAVFGGEVNTTTSGRVFSALSGTTTNMFGRFLNTSGDMAWGLESSAGATLFTGAPAYAAVVGSLANKNLALGTNSAIRFQINAAGDWLMGSNIMDSNGTPVIASGFGAGATIAGNDSVFTVTLGAASTSGQVTLGHAYTNGRSCTASTAKSGDAVNPSITSSTGLQLTYPSASAVVVYVLCRSY